MTNINPKDVIERLGFDPSLFHSSIDELFVEGAILKTDNLNPNDQPALSDFERSHLGKITCSNFGRVTYERSNPGVWSETAETYLGELIFEHDTGLPEKRFQGNAATEFGNEWENAALDEYEVATGNRIAVRQKMILLPGTLLIGGTPDAVTEGGIVVEVKTPYNPKNHYRTAAKMSVPSEYKAQVLGEMLLTDAASLDFVSFNPRSTRPKTRLIIVNCPRPSAEISDLRTRLLHFEQTLIDRLEALGIEPRV